MYWKTKDGQEIEIIKLDTFHLINIIKSIRKKAKDGMTITYSLGYGEHSYIEYDTCTIYGKDVFDRLPYLTLIKELIKRVGYLNIKNLIQL